LENDSRVANIDLEQGFDVEHIQQFVNLWERIFNVHLSEGVKDTISWKLIKDGSYSAASAYKMQFEGTTLTTMEPAIWKAWTPPKCKLFAWLVLQNRVWMADRLARRSWPNCGNLSPLQSSSRVRVSPSFQVPFLHKNLKCHSTLVWATRHGRFGLTGKLFLVGGWSWPWDMEAPGRLWPQLLMLLFWASWNERNARVFSHQTSPVHMVIKRSRMRLKCGAWPERNSWVM
jgi:hypothetical protein